MSEADIRERIAVILAAADSAAVVHQYQRFSSDLKTFIDLFRDGDNRIHGWVITRRAVAKRELTSQIQRVYVFSLRGYYGMKDSAATEQAFQTMLDTIADAFDNDYTLGGTCETTTPEWGPMSGLAGLQIEDIDLRMFGGVLCHFAECRLGVQVDPE